MTIATNHVASSRMRVLPVLDLLGGQVVHAVAGKRSCYRPIESALAAGSDPLVLAAAIAGHTGLMEFYVADLDGLLSSPPDLATLHRLSAAGFVLHVDAGVRTVDEFRSLMAHGASRAIIALENSPGPEPLVAFVEAVPAAQLMFSLDLRYGESLTPAGSAWRGLDALSVADRVIEMGISALVVLDLARVGVSDGLATLSLCRELRRRHPSLELWTGGGVRDDRDLQAAAAAGVDGLLVSTALHQGRLSSLDTKLASRVASAPGPNLKLRQTEG